MKIEYAGHSAVFVHTEKGVIAIDPWISGNPICPENLKNPPSIDLIALTHGHSDHASDAARLAKQYGCTIAATYELAACMLAEGVPERHVAMMNKGGTIHFDSLDLSISLTHAMHSNSYEKNGENVYAGEACGVVLKTPSQTIYHAGDTALFSDMELIGTHYKPDICLLPIGDRFTMGPEEAAEAVVLLKPKVVIPIHHSTFPLLTGTPEQFKNALEKRGIDAELVILTPGGVYEVS